MYSANEDYLAEILTEADLVTASQIEDAKAQRQPGENIVDVLLRTGQAKQSDVARACAIQSGMEFVDLTHFTPPEEVVALVELDDARRYKIVPVGFEQNRLQLAVSDPFDFETLDSLNHVLSYDIDAVHAPPEQVSDAISRWYAEAIGGVEASKELVVVSMDESPSAAGAEPDSKDAPIIKLVAELFKESFAMGASDIHIEPLEKSVRVRYRIDGMLHEVASHPRNLLSAIIARIKIMTGAMSIAEKRLPQDARIQLKLGERDMDLRVSTVPTNHGESVVMRLLDREANLLSLEDLGITSSALSWFRGAGML